MQKVYVQGTIRLDQFLKWSRVATTGGESKVLIANHMVRINDKIETKRTRQLTDGDVVQVQDAGSFRVVFK